jgi:membrane protein DedA with SNARE-associated domain
MLPGCALWAAIYSLGGLAVVAVWWRLFLESPALAGGAPAAVLAVLAAVAVLRRRRARSAPRGDRVPSA